MAKLKVKMIPMIMVTRDDLPEMCEVAQDQFTVDCLLRDRFDSTKKEVDNLGEDAEVGYHEQANKSLKVITIYVQNSDEVYDFIVAKADLKK